MHKRIVVSSILFIILISTVDSKPRNQQLGAERSENFDVLIFTQRWPQTVCFVWKKSSASHHCSLPGDDEWTIHGIWPSRYHTMNPQFCNKSLPFDANALKPIEQELKEKWIDVENGREPYSFWKHEWDKHGTCAAILERMNTELKYFQEGLDLLNTYEMKNVLAKANVLPGFKYAFEDIFNAIERVLGKRGMITCVKNKETEESYLFELRICFDKNLELTHCDGIFDYPTNCDHAEKLTYPGDVPQNYHVLQV